MIFLGTVCLSCLDPIIVEQTPLGFSLHFPHFYMLFP